MDAVTALFSFGELFNDFNFILKIFVMMTVINFVKNHLGTGPLSWIIVVGMAFFIFSNLWVIFGGAFLLYALLMFGISAILIDFFFISMNIGFGKPQAQPGMPSFEEMQKPVSSGVDVSHRMSAAMHPRLPMGR